jgi:hypothetical protein
MITIQSLKDTIASLGYKWFEDQPNLIGIRTKLQVPDTFNDILCLVYKQSTMPVGLSDLDKQKWLNAHSFTDVNGNPLKEDGNFGPVSQGALAKYNSEVGKERLFTATITTEPGTTYQKKLLNAKGCWVMMPAQMINAYKSGFHQGKSDHRCLQSVGKIFGLREDDQDGILFNDKNAVATWVEGNTVGANIHGASKVHDTTVVGPWSAGCQVHSRWSKKEEMMNIIDTYKGVNKGLITYTLINETDLK